MPKINELNWAVLQPPQKPRPAWNFSTDRLRRKRKSQVVKYKHEENKDNSSKTQQMGAGAVEEKERDN